MKSIILAGSLMFVAGIAAAQQTCTSGRQAPDLGYGFLSCRDCLSLTNYNGSQITKFTSQPALFRIRADGPSAGKLMEGDTLVAVDGFAVTSMDAAIRLAEWRPGSMQLTVRRGGSSRTLSITPPPVCASGSPQTENLAELQRTLAELSDRIRTLEARTTADARSLPEFQDLRARTEYQALLTAPRADSATAVRAPGAPAVTRYQPGATTIGAMDSARAKTLTSRVRLDSTLAARLLAPVVRRPAPPPAVTGRRPLDSALAYRRVETAPAPARLYALPSRTDTAACTPAPAPSTAPGSAAAAAGKVAPPCIGVTWRRAETLPMTYVRPTAPDSPLPPLGVGLRCDDCLTQRWDNGQYRWVFSKNPVVEAVEPGSYAERIGVRKGDTLTAVDGMALTSRAGGERLGTLAPGQRFELAWRGIGGARTATGAMPVPPALAAARARVLRASTTVGNAVVEVRGGHAVWTRDERTGAFIISGDSITVVVQPAGAGPDAVRPKPAASKPPPTVPPPAAPTTAKPAPAKASTTPPPPVRVPPPPAQLR
jgi:membrane-associated protease RseP (regulator of RpoE activity)